MSSQKLWSVLRKLLEEQAPFADRALISSTDSPDLDPDTRAARALQGKRVDIPSTVVFSKVEKKEAVSDLKQSHGPVLSGPVQDSGRTEGVTPQNSARTRPVVNERTYHSPVGGLSADHRGASTVSAHGGSLARGSITPRISGGEHVIASASLTNSALTVNSMSQRPSGAIPKPARQAPPSSTQRVHAPSPNSKNSEASATLSASVGRDGVATKLNFTPGSEEGATEVSKASARAAPDRPSTPAGNLIQASCTSTSALLDPSVATVADAVAGSGWSKQKALSGTASEILDVAHYGLKPLGANPMHDWAFAMLQCGARCEQALSTVGPTASPKGDLLKSVPSSNCGKTGGIELGGLEVWRQGVLEVKLSLLDVDASTSILALRRALRSWRDTIEACVRLLACQSSWSPGVAGTPKNFLTQAVRPPAVVDRIERLTVAFSKSEASLEKSRSKALTAHQKYIDKASRAAVRASRAAFKAAKSAQKDQQSKLKGEQAEKVLKQVKKQASFMSKFVRKRPSVLKGSLSPTSAAIRRSPSNAGMRDSPQKCHDGTSDFKRATSFEFIGFRFPSHGLPLLPDLLQAPSSRWLLSLTYFMSEDDIDSACRLPKPAQQVFEIRETLSRCARLRKAAVANLGAVLEAHRSSRTDGGENRCPRISGKRYPLRRRSTAKYGMARYKLLQFDGDIRPAFVGTFRKKSPHVHGRKPLGRDKGLDYEYESADDWEEEEPGEMLTDDEKDRDLEVAELQTLGMLHSDEESDDDDFFDDSGADEDSDDEEDAPAGAPRERVHGQHDVQKPPGAVGVVDMDMAEVVGQAVMTNNVVDVDAIGCLTTGKRAAQSDSLPNTKPRKRRRRHTGSKGFRAPKISVIGPIWDVDVDDPVLDMFPIFRPSPTTVIDMGVFDTEVPVEKTDGGAQISGRRPRRKNDVVLDENNFADLERIIRANMTRGRDAIVDLFLGHLRKGGFMLPSKAEVLRSIDTLAVRGKHSSWQFRRETSLSRRPQVALSAQTVHPAFIPSVAARSECTPGLAAPVEVQSHPTPKSEIRESSVGSTPSAI